MLSNIVMQLYHFVDGFVLHTALYASLQHGQTQSSVAVEYLTQVDIVHTINDDFIAQLPTQRSDVSLGIVVRTIHPNEPDYIQYIRNVFHQFQWCFRSRQFVTRFQQYLQKLYIRFGFNQTVLNFRHAVNEKVYVI